ncbi:MAG: pilus assembly protein [Syntrophomonadaceae bacterium]|nr:pilus assembly protein [Syntrophomonadaceae bacterium]
MLWAKRVFGNEHGQALVEMALVLPLLLLLFLGIFEFGRILGSYMLISNLSREGARYGVVGHDDNQIQALILSRRAWLDENQLLIIVSPPYLERDKGEPLNVGVNYSVDLMTPFYAQFLPDPLPLSTQCTMRVE